MRGLLLFDPPFIPIAALGGTWHGPLVLLTIPATLVWVSFGAQSRRGVLKGIAAAAVVFALCALAIWYSDTMFVDMVWDDSTEGAALTD